MFYQLDDDTISIKAQELDDKILTVGFISLSELEDNYRSFGFYAKSVEKCKKSSSFISDIDMLDGYCFFILSTISDTAFGVFIKKNLLLLVNLKDEGSCNRDYFLSLVSGCENDCITLERLICSFFELVIADSSRLFENKRKEIRLLEENVVKSSTDSNFNHKLLSIRGELLLLVSFYEKMTDISEVLSENANQLFDESQTKAFRNFTKKAERIKNNTDLLSDSVVHLWDSFQAHLDTKLNETMKIFTMITTIFFPLTVIVGWYGMNFHFMPELSMKWGYPFVIALSVVVVVVLIIWFRIKKWI